MGKCINLMSIFIPFGFIPAVQQGNPCSGYRVAFWINVLRTQFNKSRFNPDVIMLSWICMMRFVIFFLSSVPTTRAHMPCVRPALSGVRCPLPRCTCRAHGLSVHDHSNKVTSYQRVSHLTCLLLVILLVTQHKQANKQAHSTIKNNEMGKRKFMKWKKMRREWCEAWNRVNSQ